MADIYDFEEEKDKRLEKYEKCVICKKRTDVLKTTPIEERDYYVEGVGQLCKKCYLKMKS